MISKSCNLFLSFDTIFSESNGLRYEIKDLYKVGRNSKEVEMVPYAEWTPLEGMRVAEKRIWKRRSNLKGYQIK